MRKSLLFLLLSIGVLLAGCNSPNEPEEQPVQENEAETPEVETPQDEASQEESDLENEEEKVVEKGDTIGVTMEEFKERFNKQASERNIEFKVDSYEWRERDEGLQTAELEFAEDIRLTALGFEDEELKSVLLEVEGHESRQLTFDLIETLIASSNVELKENDIQEIMAELGLTDSKVDGDDTQSGATKDGLKYLVNDETLNWLEFVVANVNDADFELE